MRGNRPSPHPPPDPNPADCAQVLEVVRAMWEGNQALGELILSTMTAQRVATAALILLDGTFTTTAQMVHADREHLLRHAQAAFMSAMEAQDRQALHDIWKRGDKP